MFPMGETIRRMSEVESKDKNINYLKSFMS